jgi:uncharacterized integral membrane protein
MPLHPVAVVQYTFTHKQYIERHAFTPGGSSTAHIYTQTVHRTTQLTTLVGMLSGIRTHNGQY